MMYLIHAVIGTTLMACVCWASNVWPGRGFIMGAIGRLIWWALPIWIIMLWLDCTSTDQAFFVALGAWCGSWVPQSDPPNSNMYVSVLLSDLAFSFLRSALLLIPIAAMLYLCGLFWFEMIKAACLTITCVGLGNLIPSRIHGLKQGHELTGVLFGALVGFFLVTAGAIPSYQPEILP
jgi:hypothetical protein